MTEGKDSCIKCNNGYYLNSDDKCVSGTIDHCVTYVTSADEC